MEQFSIHFNITQDVGHGVTLIFICCILVIAAVLLDLWTGVDAARKTKEKIRSKMLRRTINKTIDYLRVIIFGVLIDVLGLAFPWYSIPYCAILCTLGTLAIEGKSVLENMKKKKSQAGDVVTAGIDFIDEISDIINRNDKDRALDYIKSLKEKDGRSDVKTDSEDYGGIS